MATLDIEIAISQVEELGGSNTGERHDYGDGIVVVTRDPEDHEFCRVSG